MARFDAARIRRYYDHNTAAFVAYGQGGGVGAIHRAVWGPGVADRAAAFRYVDDRIAAIIAGLHVGPSGATTEAGPRHVLDLGCGVGASLCYLAARLPLRATGITLSPAQAALARQRIAEARLSDRVVCLEGDYTNLPPEVGAADAAFAIESFVHAPEPDRFFAECARLLRPGGALIICDDCRRPASSAAANAAIERFCRGWHVNTLLTPAQLRRHAAAAGLDWESTEDLTPYLELGRPRDRLIALLTAPARWLPIRSTRLDPLLGGTALQTCLRKGWMGYELSVFRRR